MSSHPHTQHYLQSIIRAHRTLPSSSGSPLPAASTPSPPPPPSDSSEDQDPPPASFSSASSLSSSPRKEALSTSFDRGSSLGGEEGGGGGRGLSSAEGGELANQVATLLDDEDEETLKELLRDELGLGYETKVDATLDAYIIKLMHTHRDDSNQVPFIPTAANTTPKRASSRSSNPSLSKASIPFRPLTPLPVHTRSQSPSSSSPFPSYTGQGSSPSFLALNSNAYSILSSSPSPKLHHPLPSSPLSSPVPSPRTLSANATEFRPSPRPNHSSVSALSVSSAASNSSGAGVIDWSTVGGGKSPGKLTRSLSSNLAIAAPLFGSASLGSDPAFRVTPHPPLSAYHGLSSSSTRSSTPRIDDDEDDFSPFGTSLLPSLGSSSSTTGSSSWPPSSYPDVHPDQEEADLLEIEWAMAEEQALIQDGGGGTVGSSMTPMEVLGSIFTSLTTHELEVALHKWGYDLDSTMQYLIAAGESGDASSPLGAVKAFVPREGYVVAGGRNGSFSASNVAASSNSLLAGGGAMLQHGASASRVVGDGAGTGGVGSPSRFGTRSPFGGRVCRYYLQGECRRADCRFSHDIERALCRFWLRGQCAKGDSCEFIHNLPSGFDPLALSTAIANIELSTSPDALVHLSRGASTPQTPPPEDFPELGGGSSAAKAGSASSRVPAVRIDAGRTRFSSAVKKPQPQPLPLSSSSRFSSSSSIPPLGPSAASRNGNVTPTTSSSSNPLPRPSTRITLRPPSLLPTLPTGAAMNSMYLAARSRAIQLGAMRNQCLSKAADAWRKGDGASAARFSRQGQEFNEKMTAEGAEAAAKLVKERRRIAQEAIMARPGGSTSPLDRSRKGKEVGGGLGVLMGVASSSTSGAVQCSSAEREEALIDLHGLHGTEGMAMLESYLLALEGERFQGLAYALVGEEKHTGSQDVGRGASKVRLSTAVKEWLSTWGYAWSESSGVLCIDPLSHFDP